MLFTIARRFKLGLHFLPLMIDGYDDCTEKSKSVYFDFQQNHFVPIFKVQSYFAGMVPIHLIQVFFAGLLTCEFYHTIWNCFEEKVTRMVEKVDMSGSSSWAEGSDKPSNTVETNFTVDNSDERPTKQVLHEGDNMPLSEAETMTTAAPTVDSSEGARPMTASLQQTNESSEFSLSMFQSQNNGTALCVHHFDPYFVFFLS